MEIILNATLAGGVAMGSSADIIQEPYGAMLLGFIAGAISALGFAYGPRFFKNKLNLHDTCGVLYLHGIPGTIGGLVAAIVSKTSEENFGSRYNDVFLEVGRSSIS